MERVISKEEIVNLHMVQQLERKKALAVNLILARERQTDKALEASDGMLTREDFEHYEIGMNVSYPNGSFPKQFFLPNYFRGENAYFPTGKSAVYRQNTETAKTALQAYEEDIMMSDEVKECKNIPVFPGILAEHSGVASDWMSFTSNFDEALFYACCICDKETSGVRWKTKIFRRRDRLTQDTVSFTWQMPLTVIFGRMPTVRLNIMS